MYSIYVLIFKTKKKIVLTRNMAKKKVFSVLCSPLSLSRVLLQLQTKSTKISYLARHAQSTLQFANLFNFFSINKWGGGGPVSTAAHGVF